MKNLIILIVISVLLYSCDDDKKDDISANFNQAEMLTNLSQEVFIPNYIALNESVIQLDTKWQSFKGALDSTTMEELRAAFEVAYTKYQLVNYLEFGPAANISLRNNTNTFPTDTSKIKTNIRDGIYNVNTLSSYTVKGFPAMDYLLFEQEVNATVTLFKKGNRVQYMDALMADLKVNTETVLNEWKTSYTTTFNTKTGSDVGSSIGILVNAWNQHYERNFRDGKIGIPVGIRSLGVILPEKCEAVYSGISTTLAIENLEAMEKMYLGVGQDGINRKSFDDYLIAINAAELDNDIKNQFSIAHSKLQELGSPLSEEIKNDQAKVQSAYQELQKLILLIKIELPSRLGILITYQDNDGD